MDEQNLPSFERPPVIETMLGVQFQPLPALRSAHLGAFWKTLGEEWPVVLDASIIAKSRTSSLLSTPHPI